MIKGEDLEDVRDEVQLLKLQTEAQQGKRDVASVNQHVHVSHETVGTGLESGFGHGLPEMNGFHGYENGNGYRIGNENEKPDLHCVKYAQLHSSKQANTSKVQDINVQRTSNLASALPHALTPSPSEPSATTAPVQQGVIDLLDLCKIDS